MREFNLWDLMETFGTKEQKKIMINLPEEEYNVLDCEVIELANTIRDKLEPYFDES